MAEGDTLIQATARVLSFVLEIEQILAEALRRALEDPEAAALPQLPKLPRGDG